MSSSERSGTNDNRRVRVELLNWPLEPLDIVDIVNVPNPPAPPLDDFPEVTLERPRFVHCKKKGDLNRFCRKIRILESRPLLTCRSNEHGIEVVLSFIWLDCSEDPTYMAWRTFKVQERKYTLYDRAAAAIYFGLLKFKSHLNKEFTIVTDFKPLVPIFNLNGLRARRHTLPPVLKCVADELISYNYKIIYRTNAQIKESLR